MKINQIYSVLNDINSQMWGASAGAVEDLSGIVSMGTALIGNAVSTDKFLNLLVDRIGKTTFRTLDIELDFPGLYMDSFTFGAVLQKITCDPIAAEESNDYNVGDNNFSSTLLDVRKPSVSVKYFDGLDTASFCVTIPRNLFESAFESETAMANFFSAIISALNDSLVMSLNNMSRTAVNNFIAEKFKANNGCINLLAEYNTAFPNDTITAAETMYSPAFIRFATNYIKNYVDFLKDPTVLYNAGGKLRATARDNMHILANTLFANAAETYLQADTFWKDLVSLPKYTKVNQWQSNTDGNDINTFDTNTMINVIPSSEEGQLSPTAVNKTGILMVLADRQAIAVGINKRYSGVFTNPLEFYSTMKEEFSTQWINDLDENGIIFYVEDTTP